MRKISEKVKSLLPGYVYQELISLPENGLAEIRPANPKRTGNIMIREYTDAEGNHRPFLDEHGNPRTFRYEKKVLLDFSKVRDCLEFLHVRDHKFTREGVANNIPILHVIDLNKQARSRISKKDLEAKVNGKISELDGDKLFDFARILLVPIIPGASPDMIKELVYKKAESNPKDVLDEFISPDRYVKEVFFKAKAKGIISDRLGTWFFQTEKIGVNQDQAIMWLKTNEDLIPRIVSMTTGDGKVAASAPEVKAPVVNPPAAKVGLTEEDEANYKEFVEMGDTAVKDGNFAEAITCFENALAIKKVPFLYGKVKSAKAALEIKEKDTTDAK